MYQNDDYQYGAGGYYDGGRTVDSHIVTEGGEPEGGPRKPGKGKKAVRFVAGALVFGLVAAGAFQGVNLAVDQIKGGTAAKQEEVQEPGNSEAVSDGINSVPVSDVTDGQTIVSQVAKNAMPSIVAINCTALNSTNFFGQVYQQPTQGSGSGIIIGQNDSQLLIATNNHVVAGDDAQVEIVFMDESTAKAEIKGTDPSADLAVVAVNLEDLTQETKDSIRIASLGDSDEVEVGDMAIAIGNALGYGQSVTAGYISATERKVQVEDATMTLLQTDAAINPGNSGGALLNAKGEVIGINSVKLSATEVEGIGYAIPISKALPIIKDLMNREAVDESERAYLGIIGDNVTDEISERFGIPKGVFVTEVTKGSPAYQAGLSAGNVIVGIDGRTVSNMEELSDILSYRKAGESVKLDVRVFSNGEYKEKKITVTFGSRPSRER